jgi:hypothetical protein
MTIWDRDIRHYARSHRISVDQQTFWLAALATAALGSWVFALLVVVQDNAFP